MTRPRPNYAHKATPAAGRGFGRGPVTAVSALAAPRAQQSLGPVISAKPAATPSVMASVFSIFTMVLGMTVSGCADLLGTEQPPQAMPAPPDKTKLVQLATTASLMAKLSGTGEVSPLHAARAPQRGDWVFCIKSASDQTRYTVMIKDNAILDVRPAVVIDGCYNETYEPVGAP